MTTPTSMAFLFLDECFYEPLDLAALTGVLVPLESYVAVRDALCGLVVEVLRAPPNAIPAVVEIHARELLAGLSDRTPEELDRERLHVLKTIVEIINKHGLHVFRVAYLNRTEIAEVIPADPKLYGLNFFGIQSILQDVMQETIILPIMDGIPGCATTAKHPPRIDPQLIRSLSKTIRFAHHCRQYDYARDSISIRNTGRLAEPVFADSEHSVLLQLTDLVSYLLLQIEREELQPDDTPSEYRKAALQQAHQLHIHLVHTWKGRMEKHR